MPMDTPNRCSLTGLHSRVNILTETTRKPSTATRLRDLVAGDGGFTLLETLAVMVIIGLLAAITVPQIAKWREKAYITALKTDARNVANAVEAFYVDHQRYPANNNTEYADLVASDVKLNPGNSAPGYPCQGCYATTGDAFYLRVYSSKTDRRALYRSDGSPTITIYN